MMILCDALESFSPILGRENVVTGSFRDSCTSNSYLPAFGAGGGSICICIAELRLQLKVQVTPCKLYLPCHLVVKAFMIGMCLII
ncbi:MAG: hypothetical protein IPO26_20205 [Saprospiraceae bacterium]|nr:hypothetical protein [Saprospiraceae bacterium]